MPEPTKSSFAASALKVILIFGSGAAAWALLVRWLNREEGNAQPGALGDGTAPFQHPFGSMPQFVPMPYPFAVPQALQPQAQPTMTATVGIVEEIAPEPRRRKRKSMTDMTVDEYEAHLLERKMKQRMKIRVEQMFDDDDLLEEVGLN